VRHFDEQTTLVIAWSAAGGVVDRLHERSAGEFADEMNATSTALGVAVPLCG
jgi:hypothetical protein